MAKAVSWTDSVALLGQLLEDRPGVESHAQLPPQLVQHVPDTDVLRLAEDPVAALGERDDLGVPSGGVQQRGIVAAALGATDLDMGDAVVDPNNGHSEGTCEGPCGRTGNAEARTETRTHRERYEPDVGEAYACLVHGATDYRGHHVGVVVGGFSGMQAPLLGTEHVQLVGKDVAFVIDDPHTERVGGPLDPQSNHEGPDTFSIFEVA